MVNGVEQKGKVCLLLEHLMSGFGGNQRPEPEQASWPNPNSKKEPC